MTIGLALEYIPRRMKELGHGDRYLIRFRHLVMQPQQVLEIEAYGHLYILTDEPQDIRISSDMGIFDLNSDNANEMAYEHQGLITVKNYKKDIRNLRFIQVIPKHKATKNNGY